MPGLVGGAGHDQVFGQLRLDLGQRCVDSLTEFTDVFSRSHLNRDRDGARTLPIALCVARFVIVEKAWRAVITARDVHQVSQVNGRAQVRLGHGHIANFLFTLEFA